MEGSAGAQRAGARKTSKILREFRKHGQKMPLDLRYFPWKRIFTKPTTIYTFNSRFISIPISISFAGYMTISSEFRSK